MNNRVNVLWAISHLLYPRPSHLRHYRLLWSFPHRIVSFLVADTLLYKMLCPSVSPLVRPWRLSWTMQKRAFLRLPLWLSMWVCVGWVRVWMGVVCPCPPVHNDIVTPCHLLLWWGLSFMNHDHFDVVIFLFCFVLSRFCWHFIHFHQFGNFQWQESTRESCRPCLCYSSIFA